MANSTGILGGFFDSPRRQKRFLIASSAIFAIGAIAFVSTVLLRGTSNAYPDTISNQPAKIYHQAKTVPVTKAQIALMRSFIKTAAARKRLSYAYDIVDRDLKGSLTRKQWETGAIPVVQYEAENVDTVGFEKVYSYPTEALFNVNLIPVGHTQARPSLLFFIGMKREGGKKTGRWLINYWEPKWRPPVPMAPG